MFDLYNLKWFSFLILIHVKFHMIFATKGQLEITLLLVLSLTQVRLNTSNPQTPPWQELVNDIEIIK